MQAEVLEQQAITLVGMDFFGNPYEQAGGWSDLNGIGQLWTRFEAFYQQHKGEIKHRASDTGYEAWFGFARQPGARTEYIFVGVAVTEAEDLPLELVVKPLPTTRYARFTLRGPDIKSDWPRRVHAEWLPAAGLQMSHDYLIECYDPKRFKGMDNPDSELDLLVPIK